MHHDLVVTLVLVKQGETATCASHVHYVYNFLIQRVLSNFGQNLIQLILLCFLVYLISFCESSEFKAVFVEEKNLQTLNSAFVLCHYSFVVSQG